MSVRGLEKMKACGLVALCLIFSVCLVGGCLGGSTGTYDRVVVSRVTSPDGQFDAVTTREYIGGVLGGAYWDVFIVPKGALPPSDGSKHVILDASYLKDEHLIWKQSHLLEIGYDMADIEQFRNVWSSEELQPNTQHPYLVEICLAPSSADFSFLTPKGGFKPR